MKTNNNFFTAMKKYGTEVDVLGNPPNFFRQIFDLNGKTFVPFNELKGRAKEIPIEQLVPHFFVADSYQTCFIGNPKAHRDVLDKVFATFSPDYSVFVNVYPELNNAIILFNRIIAAKFQQQGRFVILTVTWAGRETFDIAFNNIEEGCVVSVSTQGIKDWMCFQEGFKEMIRRIKPSKICWYYNVPAWVYEIYPKDNIIIMPKRKEWAKIKRLSKFESQLTEFCFEKRKLG